MEEKTVERFKKRTIWFHWIHTAAFLALLVTGAILFFPGCGAPAAGGVTRIVHRVAAVIFVGGAIAYIPLNPRMAVQFVKDCFSFGKGDLGWAMAAPDYYFGGPEENMPPQGHVNTGQKMWQVVILGTGVVFVATGAMMWFWRGDLSEAIFQWTMFAHGLAFILALIMLFVHIYMGAIHPRMSESFKSILIGRISPTYARHHYGKWYEEKLQEESS
ncbi:MAG: cytochrome b/b6 domain-containing protein [Dehalococcoidia bacterium]